METNLTEDQVRKIIRNELQDLINNNKYTFSKPVQFLDGRPIQFGVSNGTKFGNAMTVKQEEIGFFDVGAVVQQNTIANPSGGAVVDSEARAAVNSIITRLKTYGLIKTS